MLNHCGYFLGNLKKKLGNFTKKLGNFLIQHLVTLVPTDSLLIFQNEKNVCCVSPGSHLRTWSLRIRHAEQPWKGQ